MNTIESCAHALAVGDTTSVALTEACFRQARDPNGEGARAFITLYDQAESNAPEGKALAMARAADARRAAGQALSPYDGVPISIKDLFDIEGETTRAGSIILRDAAPAREDAPAIARLRAAGLVFVGRTNMTEFAYGGHGINAHYGTPLNPWDRALCRIPGGSTSGGAVSVTDGMAIATIGSDTGGSVRMPAAFCGLAGIKPTQARVPLEGAFPLSFTRDSIGPLGKTVACCIVLDQLMAGIDVRIPHLEEVRGLRFGVPRNRVFDALEPKVATAVERALSRLSAAGAALVDFDFVELDEEAAGTARANFSAVEAYALHRERLATRYADFDPMVGKRLMMGANLLAADYVELLHLRKRLIAGANARTAGFDAVITPTMPMVAPRIEELTESESEFYRINALLMRNVGPFNVLNRPAITIPCHAPGTAPVGLQLVGETDGDDHLHAVALAVERIVSADLL